MARNIHYVTCPKCKGEFYVTKSFFEVKGAKCLCPFCAFEFSALDNKKATTKHSVLVGLFVLLQATLPYLMAALLFVMPLASAVEASPPYPSQPITMVVGMAAGGITDMAARALAEEAKKILKQEVLVVNKPGASQTVAMSSVITAPPDGYTLGATTDAPILRAPHMMNLNFNTITDIRPIILYGKFTSVAIVPADSPFKTFKDAFDYARQNPGKLTFGHPGIGTTPYLCPAGFGLQTGIKISFVPFPGDSAVVTALLGKHIMMGAMGPASCLSQVKAGQVRVIGVIEGEERLEAFPQAQTLHELGMQNILPPPGVVVFGQRNLPDAIAKKLEDTFLKASESPGFKKFAADNELYPVKKGGTGPELLSYLNAAHTKTGNLIRTLGLTPTKAQ